MKLSTKLRYGTRLMIELGLHYEQGPLFLKHIAKAEDISEKYLSQIIIPLKNAGLVNAFRGAKGGYVLSMPPGKISMYGIFTALEGDLSLVKCVDDPSCCGRVSKCVTRGLWDDMAGVIKDKLVSVSLQDLVRQCGKKNGHAVNYCI